MSAAFTTLFLAHLIADYPLQTAKLVKAKRNLPGLSLHVGIHLGVLLLLCLPYTASLWPYLFVLAICHFAIDSLKNLLARRRPQWIAGPYLFDQILHIVSILAIGWWVEVSLPGGWPIDRPWQIYAIAFLLATWVWYITELVLFQASHEYWLELSQQKWTRMAARAILLALLLWVEQVLATYAPVTAAVALVPYVGGAFCRRALLTDVSVTLVVAILVWFAT